MKRKTMSSPRLQVHVDIARLRKHLLDVRRVVGIIAIPETYNPVELSHHQLDRASIQRRNRMVKIQNDAGLMLNYSARLSDRVSVVEKFRSKAADVCAFIAAG